MFQGPPLEFNGNSDSSCQSALLCVLSQSSEVYIWIASQVKDCHHTRICCKPCHNAHSKLYGIIASTKLYSIIASTKL